VQKPFSKWTKLSEKLRTHSALPIHDKCALAMKSFEETHNGLQPTVDVSFDARRQELYDVNCKRFDAIIDCVLLCGSKIFPFGDMMIPMPPKVLTRVILRLY